MRVIHHFKDFIDQGRRPIVLSIGNFDGVHLGHRAVLERLKELAGPEGHTVVLTFSNHPSEVLRSSQPTPLLCTLAHRMRLIRDLSIDTLLVIPFTLDLAKNNAAQFIEKIKHFIPFSHLVLGYDATLGKDRHGDPTVMEALAHEWGFNVHYLEEFRYQGRPLSSSHIRTLLQQGQLEQVEDLLGRPYSIYTQVIPGSGKGRQIGYPTANFDVSGLCLPPYGVYLVQVKKGQQIWEGIANLGIAPTIKQTSLPTLEVHLFNNDQNFYDHYLEVIFKQFIRPEKTFANLDELRQQIQKDMAWKRS